MSGNPSHLREPVGSLLRLQEPATRPCSEPDHTSPCPPSHFHKVARNISFISTPGSGKWSLSFSFPHQNHICTLPLPETRYMPRPSHFSRFDRLNNIWWGVQIVKLSLCSFLHSPVTASLLGPNILLNTLFSNTLSLRSFLNLSDQVSHPYKTTILLVAYYALRTKGCAVL